MKIGIYIADYKREEGGGFTFEQDMISCLSKVTSHYTLIFFHNGNPSKENYFQPENKSLVVSVFESRFILSRMLRKIRKVNRKLVDLLFERNPVSLSRLKQAATFHKIDLMLFLNPYFEEVGIPFIFPVWDLAHKHFPFFPEMNSDGLNWEKRERFFRNTMPKASFVITGSEEGKKEIMELYQIPEKRIRILPLPTSSFALNKKEKSSGFLKQQNIQQPYLFYPAQFWAHKNHICLLLAMKLLKEKSGLDLCAVFTGTDKGNLAFVKQQAKKLNLLDKIYFPGFVSTSDMVELYQNAFSLVFPSFFGPDNLPPLEAFALGCPVICSNIPGAREQLGDAALYFNPLNAQELADAILLLHKNEKLKSELINKGLQKNKTWSSDLYVKGLFSLIGEFESYNRCWTSEQ